MTTKPKARKFRIRRSKPQAGVEATPEEAGAQPNEPGPSSPKEGQVSSAREMATSQNIDDIRKEG